MLHLKIDDLHFKVHATVNFVQIEPISKNSSVNKTFRKIKPV